MRSAPKLLAFLLAAFLAAAPAPSHAAPEGSKAKVENTVKTDVEKAKAAEDAAKAKAAEEEAKAKAAEEAKAKAESAAEAAAKAKAEEEARAAEEAKAVQDAWDALLATHNAQLEGILEQTNSLKKNLPSMTSSIKQGLTLLEQEYEKLNALSQVNEGTPSDLTVLVERFNRIKERIASLVAPTRSMLEELEKEKQALSLLETSLSSKDTPSLDPTLKKRLKQASDNIVTLKAQYDRNLAPADKLTASVQGRIDSINSEMPSLWNSYYFESSGRFHDMVAWARDFQNLSSVRDLFSLRLTTEIPNTSEGMVLALMRIGFVVGFLLLLALAIRRSARSRLPEEMQLGVSRLLKNSFVWIALGIACHFGAWDNGKMYQMIATVGTIFLCWGQMVLAWDLYSFDKADRTRLTPLWPLFPPLLIGMVLLNFDPFPLFTSVGWLLVQIFTLLLARSRTLPEGALPATILRLNVFQLWVTIIISLLGFARLSILVNMAFAAVAVTTMLCVSIFKVENLIEAHLPKDGSTAVISSLAMALVMPAILLVAVLASLLWMLAYPGGYFLLKHLASLGFSVGDVSLNAMQIFSIFIAFYLTRTLLLVGNTFMSGMQSQISRISVSLLAPLQIIYKCVLWAVFALYALNALGFNLSSLTVIAGGLSVGIGLGMQNMVQDFTSGLSVIFGQTIREGDAVDVAGISGIVKKINIRSTMIQTFDNAIVFVPNTSFLNGTFTNWTHNDRRVRKEVLVGVAYGSDVDQCMKLMLDIAKAHPKVLYNPAPMTLFMNFGASSLDLALRFWTTFDNGATVSSEIRNKINQVFEANGIEISFPQMDLHLRSGEFKLTPELKNALPAAESPKPEAEAKPNA